MIQIKTNNLTYNEVQQLVSFIKELKKVDYSIVIGSDIKNNSFEIDFNEV